MSKRNSFTLVELLAVIVILAIILAISIPGISSILDNVKVSAYESQKNIIEDAAKKYFAVTYDNIPVNTEKIITLKELQDNNYIDTNIKDPRTNNTISNNTWVVAKNDNGTMKFLYGYETDGLVLQYDGIYNGGLNIHNDNSSSNKAIWEDLSSNNNDGTLTNFNYTSTSGWQSDCLKFDGTDDVFTSNTFTSLPVFTAQIVLNIPTDTTGPKTYISFNNASIGTWMGDTKFSWWSSSDTYWSYGRTNTKQLQTLVGNVSNLSVMLKINNNNSETITLASGRISNIFNVSLSKLSGAINPNNFSYYTVRIYNRALTEAEIEHNYEVDKLRFGL